MGDLKLLEQVRVAKAREHAMQVGRQQPDPT